MCIAFESSVNKLDLNAETSFYYIYINEMASLTKIVSKFYPTFLVGLTPGANVMFFFIADALNR